MKRSTDITNVPWPASAIPRGTLLEQLNSCETGVLHDIIVLTFMPISNVLAQYRVTIIVSIGAKDMLVLNRKVTETIVIGDQVTVTVLNIKGDRVRLGILAPQEITVRRSEKTDRPKSQPPPR